MASITITRIFNYYITITAYFQVIYYYYSKGYYYYLMSYCV